MILWLAACSGVTVQTVEPLELSAWTVDGTGSGGVLVVQTRSVQATDLELPVPEVEGLTFSADGQPSQERLGDHTVITQRFRYTGKKGSYEIPALTVHAGELEAQSAPVWVDLGVEAPNVEQLGDIVEPDAIWTVPWTPIVAAVGIGLLLGGGGLLALVRLTRPKPKRVIRTPPDLRCLDAWEKVWADASLTEEDKASELSNIFRAYTEEVLSFPATAWTTTEIVAHLTELKHLPEGNVPRAKRLLQATDLIKYAEEEADGEFLRRMDADLRAFVGSTRPRGWDPEGGTATAAPGAAP